MIGLGIKKLSVNPHIISDPTADIAPELGFNNIIVILIGTHFDRSAGKEKKYFLSFFGNYPNDQCRVSSIHGDRLKTIYAISSIPAGEDAVSLQIGNYSIDEDATAWLNGNKLFQRHAVIVAVQVPVNHGVLLKF